MSLHLSVDQTNVCWLWK